MIEKLEFKIGEVVEIFEFPEYLGMVLSIQKDKYKEIKYFVACGDKILSCSKYDIGHWNEDEWLKSRIND